MHSLQNVWVHLVWTTKNRMPFLHSKLKILVCQHIIANGTAKGHHIDFINGIEDHLHCLIRLKSSVPLARVVNDIKGESANWINNNHFVDGTFNWQDGYGAFSVSPSQLQKVRNYIKNQERHHAKRNFVQEMDFFAKLSEE
jgi:REP element-mobilizing transposase RayT